MESADGGCHVIVCDDTESIRQLIRINLELEGHLVTEVGSAQGLVDLLTRADVSPPDLVLLDAHMAPRDGWWAIGEIRRDPRLAGLPVVLVTAGIHGLDQGVVREAGFDAVFGKPFDPDDLIALVSRAAEHGRDLGTPP